MTKNGSAVTEIEKTASAATAPPSVIAQVAVAGEEREAVARAHRASPAPGGAARARRARSASAATPTTTNDSASIAQREPQQPGRAEHAADAAGRR